MMMIGYVGSSRRLHLRLLVLVLDNVMLAKPVLVAINEAEIVSRLYMLGAARSRQGRKEVKARFSDPTDSASRPPTINLWSPVATHKRCASVIWGARQ